MPDEGSSLEEITGALKLGIFSGDAALALDRTIRAKEVTADDRSILTCSLALFEKLRDPAGSYQADGGLSQLAAGEPGLDVLTAIEDQAAGGEVEEFLDPLIDGLRRALDGDVEDEVDNLGKLLQVFIAIGDAEVERVSELSQPRSLSIPLWAPHQATSRF